MRREQPKQQPSWHSVMWPSGSSSRRPTFLLAPSGKAWDLFLTRTLRPLRSPILTCDLHSGPGSRSQLKTLRPLPMSHCRFTPTAPSGPSRSRRACGLGNPGGGWREAPWVTLLTLWPQVFSEFGFPPAVQCWVIGSCLCVPEHSLAFYGVRRDGDPAFLYLLSAPREAPGQSLVGAG